jgi:hypothetical protein
MGRSDERENRHQEWEQHRRDLSAAGLFRQEGYGAVNNSVFALPFPLCDSASTFFSLIPGSAGDFGGRGSRFLRTPRQ